MPYIPHTPADITHMLDSIGVSDIEDLFDEIPSQLRYRALDNVPDGLNERDITQLMQQRAEQDPPLLCFTGAGAYQHHIPAAVWDITTRGEFYSAYTPYQAEASQGTLQLLYEYQSMMAKLTGMEASNASLYDGASALAEAVLMAVRLYKKSCRRVLMPQTVHPLYRRVVDSVVKNQAIEIVTIPYNPETGIMDIATLEQYASTEFAALVIPQPNFFGNLEAVHELTDWAQTHGALVIGIVNPLSLAVLAPVGEWGSRGADIACGEGQPLGIPLSSGGPYFGFMCCKKVHVRQMPGRIVGRTVDLDGKEGFTLTLQAREQHIRRAKATSNICTNQGLMVTAATIYLSLLGAEGLEKNAASCHANTQLLATKLATIAGVSTVFSSPYFHETVLRFNRPVQDVLNQLLTHGILGGYALNQDYPELGYALLVCATEMRTPQQIEKYITVVQDFLV